MAIGGDGNGSGPSSSYSGQPLARVVEQVEEVLRIGGGGGKTVIITIVQQGNGAVEDVRRVEIRSLEDNILAGGERNDFPKEKALQLMFVGEVPNKVWTSTVITSKNGECLKLVLVDSETGEIVDGAPESSAEVEIVVLEGENDMTREDFERRTVKIGEKKKPHFAKSVRRNLKEGVVYLRDVKLGHDSVYGKIYKCRLGARMIGHSLYAWTSLFEARDHREKYKEKHDPPMFSSEVWRLKRIGSSGEPFKRLKGKGIETVRDFLFWFHVNAQELKQILLQARGGDHKWKVIVDHAKTCITDDDPRMHYDDDPRMYSHKSPNEPQTSVVYNFVGKLKGVIKESQFVPIDNLSAHEKDHAYELLGSVLEGSAFKERYNTPFNVEASLPSSHEVNASTSSSLQPLCQHIYQATERGSSSQSIYPNNVPYSMPSHSHVSEEMGDLCNPANPGTLAEINAGTSEDETRELSRRRSITTYSLENIWSSISGDILCDATSFQQYTTSHDGFASPVVAPDQNLYGATSSDLDVLGIRIEDYPDPTSLLPERHEIHAGSSTNWFDMDDFGACFISYTTEINAGTCGSASTGVFVGIGDENEQLRGACPISFRTRGWILMAHVLKWRLSIKKIHKVRAGDTRKRKRGLELPLEEDCEQLISTRELAVDEDCVLFV